MALRIAGIQPGYLPWLGYFDQMLRVDAFVLADELQFSTSQWAHRNRVLGPDGVHWLTLPTRSRLGDRITQVELDRTTPWAHKHMRTLRHFYGAGSGSRQTLDDLERSLDPHATHLMQVSVPTIRFIAERLQVRTPLLLSSELGLERLYGERFPERPGPCQRIIAYMDALGATELLEGEAGQSYIDHDLFEAHGKRVSFHRYLHPTYAQLHGSSFTSHLSAMDLLLSVGAEEAARVLRRGDVRHG